MQHREQVALAKRLLDFIDTKSTQLMDEVYRQPVREYTCPEQAAREYARFFRAGPLCVGLSGQLPQAGSFVTHELAGVPMLFTRDLQGGFRAFLNVCRHRGAKVARGCGTARSFTCPYHAWVYGADGALIGRPEEAAFGGAPRAEHGLVPLPAIERDGLLWICPTPGGAFDLERRLGTLQAELASFELGRFHLYATRDLERQMNWKLVVDTFLESYHFCILHKDSICPIFYQNLATFDAWGDDFRLVSPRRTIVELREQPETAWNLRPYIVGIYVLFPNTVLVWQGEQVELWQIFPVRGDPNKAVLRLSLYSPEPALTDKARRHWDKNLELVLHVVENEDFPVGESIQRGFHSPAQEHIVFGRNEPALAHYHRALSRATRP